ncbi:MAG: carboxymuconolactone decarboxylase family protein [Candidatus Brocadia sp.]|nr:carboxymuconolactone decarboxylase family protein [Candidatus Brocadia sp.]
MDNRDENNKDIVIENEEKWIDGLNRGDVSVADEMFDPKCEFYITGSQKSVGLKEFKEQVQKDLANFPGRHFDLKEKIIADDKRVFRWAATLKEVPILVEGLIIDQVENNKVVKRWEQWDQPALDVFKGLAMYKEYMGKENEKKLAGLREFTINHLYANVWSRIEHLSIPERSMITLSLLAAQGRNEELKSHLKGALNSGITSDKILEIMIHVAHYAGWPAGNNGERVAKEVFKEIKPENKKRTFLFCMLVKDGQVEDFDKWLGAHVQVTREKDEGCFAFEKHQFVGNDRIFILYEKWQNQSCLDKHLDRMKNEGLTAEMLKLLDDTRTFDISGW